MESPINIVCSKCERDFPLPIEEAKKFNNKNRFVCIECSTPKPKRKIKPKVSGSDLTRNAQRYNAIQRYYSYDKTEYLNDKKREYMRRYWKRRKGSAEEYYK